MRTLGYSEIDVFDPGASAIIAMLLRSLEANAFLHTQESQVHLQNRAKF